MAHTHSLTLHLNASMCAEAKAHTRSNLENTFIHFYQCSWMTKQNFNRKRQTWNSTALHKSRSVKVATPRKQTKLFSEDLSEYLHSDTRLCTCLWCYPTSREGTEISPRGLCMWPVVLIHCHLLVKRKTYSNWIRNIFYTFSSLDCSTISGISYQAWLIFKP